jgi:hypothetical protein
MARNGAGTYTLPAGNPVTTGTTISSSWANNTLNDIASSLTASLAYDGQTAPVANLPMATYAHTGVGNATVRTMYAAAGQVQDGTLSYLTSVSGTDTITAIAPVSMNAYVAGQTFRFIAANANTGAVTLNINSIGAKAITKNGTTALAASDIPANSVVIVTYDGTQFQISNVATLPASVSSFNAGTTGFTPSTATTGAVTLAGTLNVANGGTGATTLTSGSVIVGAGTSTPTFVAPTTTGNVLFTTNGTTWSSTAKITSGTSVASTSGTSITFSSIPSWVKRITFMINGVSTSGTNNLILRIGGGSVEATGYTGAEVRLSNAGNAYNTLSTSFILSDSSAATDLQYGTAVLTLLSSNIWVLNSAVTGGTNRTCLCQGSKTTSTTLDRISLTTEGSTDTFDAGSVNIIYE